MSPDARNFVSGGYIRYDEQLELGPTTFEIAEVVEEPKYQEPDEMQLTAVSKLGERLSLGTDRLRCLITIFDTTDTDKWRGPVKLYAGLAFNRPALKVCPVDVEPDDLTLPNGKQAKPAPKKSKKKVTKRKSAKQALKETETDAPW